MSTRAGLVIVVLLALALASGAMLGCSSVSPGPFKGTCAIERLGQTDDGFTAFRYYCEPS